MPRRPAIVLACLALAGATAVAGCGGDDSDDTAGTPATPPAVETSAAQDGSGGAPAGEVVKVNMKDIKFVPEEITVKTGQKILWTNTDGDIPHTVTAADGADFDSGNMDGGETFEFTPTEAGEIAYVCTIHANQTGTITVTS